MLSRRVAFRGVVLCCTGLIAFVAVDDQRISRAADPPRARTPAKLLPHKVSLGLTLAGLVVDEAGHPINGATVLARSQSGYRLPVSVAKLSTGIGAITSKGRFRLEHLSPGKETLRALHPDYAFAEATDLELKADGQQAPVRITMKRGGTVRGRVFDQFGRPAADVALLVCSGRLDDSAAEFAEVVSDAAGDYEVPHLPEIPICITRRALWNSLGVARQTVLPSAGKPVRADLGGVKKVTGRLVVNGVPLANTKLLLSDDSPQGEMMAFAMTDGDGNFVFRGITPGERCLYYSSKAKRLQEFVRVKPLRIETSNDAFGTIELVTGTLSIHCPIPDANAPRNLVLWLADYDPVTFSRGFVGNPVPPREQNDPFVLRELPVGKYALSINRPGKLGMRQAIEISGPGETSVTVDLPKGTASLQVTLKQPMSETGGFLQLRNKDNRRFVQFRVKPNGHFEIGELPAGEYAIEPLIMNADARATFSLAEGEKKSISLSTLEASAGARRGFLRVRPYSADGLPIPGCAATLTGAKGEIPQRSPQSAQPSFTTEAGTHQLSVSYPGFVSVSQVDVKPTPGGPAGEDHELIVTLVPLPKQTKAESK
jgi:Carboxypeptidase regulatory-like domain